MTPRTVNKQIYFGVSLYNLYDHVHISEAFIVKGTSDKRDGL